MVDRKSSFDETNAATFKRNVTPVLLATNKQIEKLFGIDDAFEMGAVGLETYTKKWSSHIKANNLIAQVAESKGVNSQDLLASRMPPFFNDEGLYYTQVPLDLLSLDPNKANNREAISRGAMMASRRSGIALLESATPVEPVYNPAIDTFFRGKVEEFLRATPEGQAIIEEVMSEIGNNADLVVFAKGGKLMLFKRGSKGSYLEVFSAFDDQHLMLLHFMARATDPGFKDHMFIKHNWFIKPERWSEYTWPEKLEADYETFEKTRQLLQGMDLLDEESGTINEQELWQPFRASQFAQYLVDKISPIEPVDPKRQKKFESVTEIAMRRNIKHYPIRWEELRLQDLAQPLEDLTDQEVIVNGQPLDEVKHLGEDPE